MKTILNTFLVLMLFSFLSYAQTQTGLIKGKITDKETGGPLIAAIVSVANTQTGTSTDFDGNYQLELAPGVYDLEIKYIGYETMLVKELKVKPDEVLIQDFELVQSNVHLELIIVESNREKQLSEQAVSVEVISSHRIQNINSKRSKKNSNKGFNSPNNSSVWAGHNTEEYDRIYENEFISVNDEPLSTFSIDVDAASYSNMRRFIVKQGMLPPPDAVRTEEMINYFNYDYPQPVGEHPFSVTTEVAPCPWNPENKLIHVGLQAKEIDMKESVPNNLVFLIDVSGSMSNPDKLPMVKRSLNMLVENLKDNDRIAIVVYAGAAGLVLPSTKGKNKESIFQAIDQLSAGGSTAGGQGIKLAYKVARENFMEKGNNRVILATDGDFNVGPSSDAALVRIIEKEREDNVFLTVLGFGTGNYKDSKMEQLADKGNGNYAYIDNMLEAKKVLVNEMGGTLVAIAKDVKFQLEFNPLNVRSYRLIGYENRLLNKEDFNDDTKDAGEMGMGHTVTALYEVVPANGKGETGKAKVDPLKYQQTSMSEAAQNAQELLAIKLRYKQPDERKSQIFSLAVLDNLKDSDDASENFRWSAAVAQFGMLLRNSKFKGSTTYHSTIALAKAAKGADEYGYRAEFIRIVETASMLSDELKKDGRAERD